jgi:6-phosphofructokinase 2
MIDILTLTMNPALDVSTSVDQVIPTHKLRCEAAQIHPGGGGINVARVVTRLGGDVVALYPAGGVTGQSLKQLLDAEQVASQVLPIAGETRESLSVDERSSGREYRFVLPGPTLTQAEWQACLDALSALETTPRYLVVSGSLPPGVPDDFYARVARMAGEMGARLVVDTSGPALAAVLAQGVYLVKPSLRELCDLTGQALDSEAQWLAAARQIIQAGQAQIVALSLGEDGALLVSADQAWRAQALKVKVASTIGAGDSFVSGLVWSLSRGDALAQAFAYGMAAGAAALMSQGTALALVQDIERLHGQVVITPA